MLSQQIGSTKLNTMLLCPLMDLYLVSATCILHVGYPPIVCQATFGLSPSLVHYSRN